MYYAIEFPHSTLHTILAKLRTYYIHAFIQLANNLHSNKNKNYKMNKIKRLFNRYTM